MGKLQRRKGPVKTKPFSIWRRLKEIDKFFHGKDEVPSHSAAGTCPNLVCSSGRHGR